MIDVRPVAHTIGRISTVLGAMMIFPVLIDYAAGDPNWIPLAQSMALVVVLSALVVAATASADRSLTIEQSFLLTSGLWLVLRSKHEAPGEARA